MNRWLAPSVQQLPRRCAKQRFDGCVSRFGAGKGRRSAPSALRQDRQLEQDYRRHMASRQASNPEAKRVSRRSFQRNRSRPPKSVRAAKGQGRPPDNAQKAAEGGDRPPGVSGSCVHQGNVYHPRNLLL